MLTAADSGTNAILIADDLVNKALPLTGRRNEMTMTTVIGGHKVSGAQMLRDYDAGKLLTDARMNRAMQPAFTEKIIQGQLDSPYPQRNLDFRHVSLI